MINRCHKLICGLVECLFTNVFLLFSSPPCYKYTDWQFSDSRERFRTGSSLLCVIEIISRSLDRSLAAKLDLYIITPIALFDSGRYRSGCVRPNHRKRRRPRRDHHHGGPPRPPPPPRVLIVSIFKYPHFATSPSRRVNKLWAPLYLSISRCI